jgi:cytochrome c oxidase subunit 4
MENPALLFGIPFILLGALGLIAALSLFAVPDEVAAGTVARPRDAHAGGLHPDVPEYLVIGIILAGVTALEVALFYIDLNHKALVTMLIFLSVFKFGLVIGWFMHLRFDNKLFTTLFLGGLFLALAAFTIVVTTLKAGLV